MTPRRFSPQPQTDVPDVRVNVLSESVFCPRAGVLARGTGDDPGDEEPQLGPQLDNYVDFDARRFIEAIHAAWAEIRHWGAWLAPALLLVWAGWWFVSLSAALLLSFPAVYLAGRLIGSFRWLLELVREEAGYAAAVPFALDPSANSIREVNWWSLRKAGFDCLKPAEAHYDPQERLAGKPWRVLTYQNALRIPVVRKHRGQRTWGPQHVVRVAAYCQLLERCEGATSPFGILLFAGSYDGLLIPNSVSAQFELVRALADARELLEATDSGRFIPPAPDDNRCHGCRWGRPQEHHAGQSDTVPDSAATPVVPARAINGQWYHSPCGDFFKWAPPHKDAVALGIAAPRAGAES